MSHFELSFYFWLFMYQTFQTTGGSAALKAIILGNQLDISSFCGQIQRKPDVSDQNLFCHLRQMFQPSPFMMWNHFIPNVRRLYVYVQQLLEYEAEASIFLMTRGDMFLPQERARCRAKNSSWLGASVWPRFLGRIQQGHHTRTARIWSKYSKCEVGW